MAPSYWRLDASSLLQPDPYDNIFGPYTRTFDEELALGPLDGVDEQEITSTEIPGRRREGGEGGSNMQRLLRRDTRNDGDK
ncbi:hypothetical protein B0A55_13354 [Friedmanniomyces simplex]|uniref:Uncharacterized protein n=1 Tax=Friedmanniomyces simplex TaxID=329884 RepID=A0A4U0WGP6_9PEZI|nr:hypothetical protein B0A55_13354 [Friedmanniomyces simplex]